MKNLHLLCGAAIVALTSFPVASHAASPLQHLVEALVSCSGDPVLPSPTDRKAWRAARISVRGFAMDGRTLFDDRRDGYADEWAELVIRLPEPVMVDGTQASTLYLSRERSGDIGEDVTLYAKSTGDVATYAHDHQLRTIPPKVADDRLTITGNGADDARFERIYGAWSKPLTATQQKWLQGHDEYDLPGPHRLPALAFATSEAPNALIVGCKWFSPETSSVDGL